MECFLYMEGVLLCVLILLGQVAGSERFSCANGDDSVGDVVLTEQLAETSPKCAAIDDECLIIIRGEQVINGGFHSTGAGCCVVDDAPAFLQPDVLAKPAHAFLHKRGVFSCAEIGDFLLVCISGAGVWLYRTDGEKFHVRCEVAQASRVVI